MIKDIECLEDFLELDKNQQSQCLMMYADKWAILYKSKERYAKQYKGVLQVNDEDLISQLYLSMAKTISKIHERTLFVKSPKTGEERKLVFKNFATRERYISLLRKKRFKLLKEEDVLIISRKYTKKELKEIQEHKKNKGYDKTIKRKTKHIKAYTVRYRASVKRRLKALGFDVREFGEHFKSFTHLKFYFRKNFIDYIDKLYKKNTAQKRNPEGELMSINKVNQSNDPSNQAVDLNFQHENTLNLETIEENKFVNVELYANSKVFLEEINEDIFNETGKNLKLPQLFLNLYSEDKKLLGDIKKELGMTKVLFDQLRKDLISLLKIHWLHEENPEKLINEVGVNELYRLGKMYLNSNKYDVLKDNLEYTTNKRIFESRDPKVGYLLTPRGDVKIPNAISIGKHYEVIDENIPDDLTSQKTYVIIGDDMKEHTVPSDCFSFKNQKEKIGECYE